MNRPWRTTATSINVAITACLVAHSAPARAEPRAPGWFVRDQVAARYNSLGLFNEARVGYDTGALGRADTMLSEAAASLAANVSVSPIFARAGAATELDIAKTMSVFAIYEAGTYFGTFGSVESFASANDAVRERGHAATPSPSNGSSAARMHQLILGAQPRLRLGILLARSNNRLVFQEVDIRGGDAVLYDPNWETVVPNGGWIYVNDIDLLAQATAKLRIGARYNVTHAFLSQAQLDSAGAPASESTTHRVGPFGSYVLRERAGASTVTSITASLAVNWWLCRSPVAAGSDTAPVASGAVPYVGMALTFTGRL